MAVAVDTLAIVLLTLHFANNTLPQRLVAEYVSQCPVCQKIRLSLNDQFKAIVPTNNVDPSSALAP